MKTSINQFNGVSYSNYDVADMRTYVAFQETAWLKSCFDINVNRAMELAKASTDSMTVEEVLSIVEKHYADGVSGFINRPTDEFDAIVHINI